MNVASVLTLNDFKAFKIGDKYDDVVKSVGELHGTLGFGLISYYYNLRDNSIIIINFGLNMEGIEAIIHRKVDGSEETVLSQ